MVEKHMDILEIGEGRQYYRQLEEQEGDSIISVDRTISFRLSDETFKFNSIDSPTNCSRSKSQKYGKNNSRITFENSGSIFRSELIGKNLEIQNLKEKVKTLNAENEELKLIASEYQSLREKIISKERELEFTKNQLIASENNLRRLEKNIKDTKSNNCNSKLFRSGFPSPLNAFGTNGTKLFQTNYKSNIKEDAQNDVRSKKNFTITIVSSSILVFVISLIFIQVYTMMKSIREPIHRFLE